MSLPPPDLIIQSSSISGFDGYQGDIFSFSATVRNTGGSSGSGTLRYEWSTSTRFSSTTSAGTDSVSLSSGSSGGESSSIRAPSTSGTYYYRACVVGVSGEVVTNNNCSGYFTIVIPPGLQADHSGSRSSSATVVVDDSATSGYIAAINSDSDYFRIRVYGRGVLRAYSTGSTDTYVQIYDNGGTVVASNDDGGAGSNFSTTHTVGVGLWRTFYMRVRGYRTGAYVLHVSFD